MSNRSRPKTPKVRAVIYELSGVYRNAKPNRKLNGKLGTIQWISQTKPPIPTTTTIHQPYREIASVWWWCERATFACGFLGSPHFKEHGNRSRHPDDRETKRFPHASGHPEIESVVQPDGANVQSRFPLVEYLKSVEYLWVQDELRCHCGNKLCHHNGERQYEPK